MDEFPSSFSNDIQEILKRSSKFYEIKTEVLTAAKIVEFVDELEINYKEILDFIKDSFDTNQTLNDLMQTLYISTINTNVNLQYLCIDTMNIFESSIYFQIYSYDKITCKKVSRSKVHKLNHVLENIKSKNEDLYNNLHEQFTKYNPNKFLNDGIIEALSTNFYYYHHDNQIITRIENISLQNNIIDMSYPSLIRSMTINIKDKNNYSFTLNISKFLDKNEYVIKYIIKKITTGLKSYDLKSYSDEIKNFIEILYRDNDTDSAKLRFRCPKLLQYSIIKILSTYLSMFYINYNKSLTKKNESE